jgi:NAD(P)-dependent dehydrogenase (short-subunit alcohol dehydrogenase family)
MAVSNARTIVWITGATQGIGQALARAVPYPDARVINISRRQHPELETVVADLTDPESWGGVGRHLTDELAAFDGERAIFIHNANYGGSSGFVGEIDPVEYRRQVFANSAASLVLGDAFIRACGEDYESGLVMISSASAKFAMQGMAVYGAAKAGMEQWVRAVRAERKTRGAGPWVVAIRPGFVVTESMREQYAVGQGDLDAFPGGRAVAQAIAEGRGQSPQECARSIWALLPPEPDGRTVLFLGEFIEGSQG